MTYTKIARRGLLHIEGIERAAFLQGLITNDITALDTNKGNTNSRARAGILYACLLNAQGKFLHDFFIHKINGSDTNGDAKGNTRGAYLIDCEGGARAQDLFNRLTMYRLRSDVQISIEADDHIVYAGFDFDTAPANAHPDPRHNAMGWRSFEKPENADEQAFSAWDERRITLCVPDGSRDLITGKSTISEGRIAVLNGVSYDKGCYVGQELTARMHYRGLTKKQLYGVRARNENTSLPECGAPIIANEKTIGEMRSSCGHIGLAVLKDKELSRLTDTDITLLEK